MAAEFENGFWIWDEINDGLNFTRHEKDIRDKESLRTVQASTLSTTAGPAIGQHYTAIRFTVFLNNIIQGQFRKFYRRRVRTTEIDVVTIQDVKDVVLFTAEPEDLTVEFVKFFHLPTMDYFLRAAAIYFQYYFQIWDHIIERREEAKTKLTQPIVYVLEDVIMDNLKDLRSILSREYHRLTSGIDDAIEGYHMNNKNNTSTSEKDRRLFEGLMSAAVRVIWCTLQRKNFYLIETELNRLLRTKIFNLVEHRKIQITTYNTFPSEKRYLIGSSYHNERKLKHRSPAAQELIFGEQDYKMLAIGVCQIEQFHLAEAWWRRIQNLGMFMEYKNINRKMVEPDLCFNISTSTDHYGFELCADSGTQITTILQLHRRHGNISFRHLGCKYRKFSEDYKCVDDERQKYLEIAYTAPEELLLEFGVGIGLLGYPRNRLDAFLQPKERTKADVHAKSITETIKLTILFHLAEAWWRRIQNLGMFMEYKNINRKMVEPDLCFNISTSTDHYGFELCADSGTQITTILQLHRRHGNISFRHLGCKYRKFSEDYKCVDDERQKYLEIAYTAPEELLLEFGVGIGLLGYPRNRLDAFLQPKERTKADVHAKSIIIPEFKIPPKIKLEGETFAQTLPRTECEFKQTSKSIANREQQLQLWIRHVEAEGQLIQQLLEERRRSSVNQSYYSFYSSASKLTLKM